MAYSISIHNLEGTISAEIVPVHGGMVAQLYIQDRPLLKLDRATLETAPMAAGGMPVLFPFPSKTRNDQYTLNGKTYYMPMHGLVKNAPFAVEKATENSVNLWIEENPAWVAGCYPYRFRLEICYTLEGDTLSAELRLTNRSDKPMPHYLGWHPFFYSSDKRNIYLEHSMQVHYDYEKCVDSGVQGKLDLSTWLDDVFHSPLDNRFTLTNVADGYRVECRFDQAFQSLVVCSWVQDSMCVEPWCGLPDSINQNRFLQWVEPGETCVYNMELICTAL